jgi:Myristoyl-CoA:protein N-myristoyltransferase, N-terminal domain
LMFFGYIKLYHPFWYIQPVFHFYNVFDYFRDGHVLKDSPIESKYINNKNIKTCTFAEASQYTLQETIALIQQNFLRQKDNDYIPDLLKNFLPYFNSNKETCLLTLYFNERVLMNVKNATCFKDTNQIVGVITSVPITMHLFQKIHELFYVDYFCIQRQFRKTNKQIAEQLIQTHERNQRRFKPDYKISLFKREGTLNFIVPLCVYKTFLRKSLNKSQIKNTDYLIEFPDFREISNIIEICSKRFNCCIHLSLSTLNELIQTKNMFAVQIVEPYTDDTDKKIVAIYFFKDSCTTALTKKMLICIGSVLFKESFKHLNQHYFQETIVLINKKSNDAFNSLIIENVADNHLLIIHDEDDFFHNMAFFFYNYAQTSISPETFLFLG